MRLVLAAIQQSQFGGLRLRERDRTGRVRAECLLPTTGFNAGEEPVLFPAVGPTELSGVSHVRGCVGVVRRLRRMVWIGRVGKSGPRVRLDLNPADGGRGRADALGHDRVRLPIGRLAVLAARAASETQGDGK